MAESRLAPVLADTQSFALIGRFPGLALATKARLLMSTAYPIATAKSAGILQKTQAFYQTRHPDYVAIYRDSYFQFVNPIPDFDRRYGLIATWSTPLGSLELFSRQLRGEIVLVNDASPDASWSVIDGLARGFPARTGSCSGAITTRSCGRARCGSRMSV